jgi:alginate O-acetyltransferase complex protein AlgJ
MNRKADHRYNILYSVLFAAMIVIPLSAVVTGLYRAPEMSERENRKLAKMPVFDLTLLDPFPPLFTEWYNDHFFMREGLIDLHIWSQINFRESPYPDKVTIGKDGWLFDAAKERNTYEGKVNIPPESYIYVMRELHKRTLWYRARGIRFYVLIAPMKAEIYPEFLPAFYRRARYGTLTDRLVNTIRKDTVIRLITLKEVMLAEKPNHRLYSKMDNHWNYVGGYFAYRALMREINKDFPDVKPLELSDFKFKERTVKGGNLSGMIGLTGKMSETEWLPSFPSMRSIDDPDKRYKVPEAFPFVNDYEVRHYIPGSKLPSIMVIRDSYGQHLFPYLSETFGRTFMLFDGWSYKLNADFVEKEKPDIVVLEIFEPHFKNIVYNLDLLMADYNKKYPRQ